MQVFITLLALYIALAAAHIEPTIPSAPGAARAPQTREWRLEQQVGNMAIRKCRRRHPETDTEHQRHHRPAQTSDPGTGTVEMYGLQRIECHHGPDESPACRALIGDLQAMNHFPIPATAPFRRADAAHADNPSLWASIRVANRSRAEFPSLLEIWLDRAQRLPVEILLSGGRHPGVEGVLRARAAQLINLEVWVQDLDVLPRWAYPWEVENMTTIPFVAVEKMTLADNRAAGRPGRESGMAACIELLHNAPRLLECTLRGWASPRSAWLTDPEVQPRIHPHLRRLYLGRFSFSYKSTAEVLRHLTLPALEVLYLSAFDINLHELHAFFERSGCRASLHTLYLGTISDGPGSEQYSALTDPISVCRLVPQLQNLDISFGKHETALPLFDALRMEPAFLPNLVNLTIQVRFLQDLATHFEQLRDALSVRRTGSIHRASIRSFSVVRVAARGRALLAGELETFELEKSQIFAALGILVQQGMDLEIIMEVEGFRM
ncbi:hypothetical protein FB45DRAFT_1125961 [Roridomyces roridus]|uniref:Uncharacterized protein n=1 Tax=Roridomyces roridus TaxID=1738132 RepID=A0AAD7C8C6_9AGAR|nr:hypothetical protein FB45DRAFT_1125961 [Roridomyces roridus]